MIGEIGSQRGRAMVRRIESAFAGPRNSAGGGPEVAEAVAFAFVGRERFLESDHDPRYLHPARTVLILGEDGRRGFAPQLIAASQIDLWTPSLHPASEVVESRFGAEVRELRDSAAELFHALEEPGREGLSRSEFGTGGLWDRGGSILLSTRFDRMRHLHLEKDPEVRAREVEGFRSFWSRGGIRIAGGQLGRQVSWWLRRVAPRL